MDKEICQRYLNKNIKVVLHNNYFYRGKCLEVTDKALSLDDVRLGECWFELSTIVQISEVQQCQ